MYVLYTYSIQYSVHTVYIHSMSYILYIVMIIYILYVCTTNNLLCSLYKLLHTLYRIVFCMMCIGCVTCTIIKHLLYILNHVMNTVCVNSVLLNACSAYCIHKSVSSYKFTILAEVYRVETLM
jgi:hypothetical protein